MEKIISALQEIREINNAYAIPTERIEALLEEIEEAKVCIPVIGKFSAGKSALLNTFLGYRHGILKEDITPETAVPTELVYAESEYFAVIGMDESAEEGSVEDYRKFEADASTVKCVRLYLDNASLEKIPDIMLVDMPGFESGYEIHSKAIDNYLPKSLAYIITFPADDMIVRKSVGDILKELCVYDMPLCVVITKYDKKDADFVTTFVKLKESLSRYVGKRKITYCRTSRVDGNVNELKAYLDTIQEQAQEIIANKYKQLLIPVLDKTENYLKALLNGSKLSESELEEQQENLCKEFEQLNLNFAKEQKDFQQELKECVAEIKADLQRTLETEEGKLTVMILNQQSIREELNTVVRNSVAVSVKQRLIPRIEKYIRRVNSTFNFDSAGDVTIAFNFDTSGLQKDVGSKIVAILAGFLRGGLLGAILTGILSAVRSSKKRDEAKQRIHMQLNDDLFPRILSEVGDNIEKEVDRQALLVNTTIEDELKEQKKTLEKAIEEVKNKKKEEQEKKAQFTCNAQTALERIENIRDELR